MYFDIIKFGMIMNYIFFITACFYSTIYIFIILFVSLYIIMIAILVILYYKQLKLSFVSCKNLISESVLIFCLNW